MQIFTPSHNHLADLGAHLVPAFHILAMLAQALHYLIVDVVSDQVARATNFSVIALKTTSSISRIDHRGKVVSVISTLLSLIYFTMCSHQV